MVVSAGVGWYVNHELEERASLPKTTEVRLLPLGVGRRLERDVAVTRRTSGECLDFVSIADAGNPFARRCFSGHFVYDPCFRYGRYDANIVVCPETPWSNHVVVFRAEFKGGASRRRPGQRPDRTQRRTIPWALELVNGYRCLFATGATFAAAGERFNYFCAPADTRIPGRGVDSSVLGEPDRSAALWTVQFGKQADMRMRTVAVRTAWY